MGFPFAFIRRLVWLGMNQAVEIGEIKIPGEIEIMTDRQIWTRHSASYGRTCQGCLEVVLARILQVVGRDRSI
jgi:hypothetical protein